jgi:alanyl-tRNA synthetase
LFPPAAQAAVEKGAHAGNLLKEVSAVTGGRGGGRPDSATSGGSDMSKVAEALAGAADVLEKNAEVINDAPYP